MLWDEISVVNDVISALHRVKFRSAVRLAVAGQRALWVTLSGLSELDLDSES